MWQISALTWIWYLSNSINPRASGVGHIEIQCACIEFVSFHSQKSMRIYLLTSYHQVQVHHLDSNITFKIKPINLICLQFSEKCRSELIFEVKCNTSDIPGLIEIE